MKKKIAEITSDDFQTAFGWLDYQDSNLVKQNQNLLCYHYTIVQSTVLNFLKRCKYTLLYRH